MKHITFISMIAFASVNLFADIPFRLVPCFSDEVGLAAYSKKDGVEEFYFNDTNYVVTQTNILDNDYYQVIAELNGTMLEIKFNPKKLPEGSTGEPGDGIWGQFKITQSDGSQKVSNGSCAPLPE